MPGSSAEGTGRRRRRGTPGLPVAQGLPENKRNIINNKQTNATICMSTSYMGCRGVLMHYQIYLNDLGK